MAKKSEDEPKRRPVGRPPSGGKTPTMQLGRVSAEDQSQLRSAAARAGKSFTEWALAILLRAAKK